MPSWRKGNLPSVPQSTLSFQPAAPELNAVGKAARQDYSDSEANWELPITPVFLGMSISSLLCTLGTEILRIRFN